MRIGGGRRRFPNSLNARRTLQAALLAAHAYGGRVRSLTAIARFMGPHASTTDIATVADANSTYITHSGDNLSLTDAGLIDVRSHPQPRA